MNINQLTELVINKIYAVSHYNEIPEERLKNSIKKLLLVTHREEMDEALARLEQKQNDGGKIKEIDYEIEQMKVEESVIYIARCLAATTQRITRPYIILLLHPAYTF